MTTLESGDLFEALADKNEDAVLNILYNLPYQTEIVNARSPKYNQTAIELALQFDIHTSRFFVIKTLRQCGADILGSNVPIIEQNLEIWEDYLLDEIDYLIQLKNKNDLDGASRVFQRVESINLLLKSNIIKKWINRICHLFRKESVLDILDNCFFCNKELLPEDTAKVLIIWKTWKTQDGYETETVCNNLQCFWSEGSSSPYDGEWIFDRESNMLRYKILPTCKFYVRAWADNCECFKGSDEIQMFCNCFDDLKPGEDPLCACKKTNFPDMLHYD